MTVSDDPRAVYPMLVLVPVRTAHEAVSLFLERLGFGVILDRTLEDAESLAQAHDVTLVVTTDDARIVEHVSKRAVDWRIRKRPEQEVEVGYFGALVAARRWAETEMQKKYASVLILEPSHPFRPSGLVSNALDLFQREPTLDTVVSVVREYGNLWTEENHNLNRIETPEGRNFFREIAGLCLLSVPSALTSRSAMGQNVAFVVVEEQWALIDIHGHDGVSLARRFHDVLQLED